MCDQLPCLLAVFGYGLLWPSGNCLPFIPFQFFKQLYLDSVHIHLLWSVECLLRFCYLHGVVQQLSPQAFRRFSSPEKSPVLISSHTPVPPGFPARLPSRSRQPIHLCLYRFPYCRHCIWMELCNMWSFVTGFFFLSIFSRFIHVACISTSFYYWIIFLS